MDGVFPEGSIHDFHEEGYEFLSNFYEVSICFDGLTYRNVEAAFQAQKCLTAEEKQNFTRYAASTSKHAGRRVQLREDWKDVKVGLMEEIVRAKFRQHPELAEKLIATGDRQLIEGNNWRDRFWGADNRTGKGENHLGQILMKIRAELAENA